MLTGFITGLSDHPLLLAGAAVLILALAAFLFRSRGSGKKKEPQAPVPAVTEQAPVPPAQISRDLAAATFRRMERAGNAAQAVRYAEIAAAQGDRSCWESAYLMLAKNAQTSQDWQRLVSLDEAAVRGGIRGAEESLKKHRSILQGIEAYEQQRWQASLELLRPKLLQYNGGNIRAVCLACCADSLSHTASTLQDWEQVIIWTQVLTAEKSCTQELIDSIRRRVRAHGTTAVKNVLQAEELGGTQLQPDNANFQKAYSLYLQAARSGSALGAEGCGHLLFQTAQTEDACEEALRWARIAEDAHIGRAGALCQAITLYRDFIHTVDASDCDAGARALMFDDNHVKAAACLAASLDQINPGLEYWHRVGIRLEFACTKLGTHHACINTMLEAVQLQIKFRKIAQEYGY